MMEQDGLAALFAQYLSGGTIPQLAQVDVRGPVFSGGGMPAGGGGIAGLEVFAQGVLDYLDKDDKQKAGQDTATGWKFNPDTDMPPPYTPPSAAGATSAPVRPQPRPWEYQGPPEMEGPPMAPADVTLPPITVRPEDDGNSIMEYDEQGNPIAARPPRVSGLSERDRFAALMGMLGFA